MSTRRARKREKTGTRPAGRRMSADRRSDPTSTWAPANLVVPPD